MIGYCTILRGHYDRRHPADLREVHWLMWIVAAAFVLAFLEPALMALLG